MICRIVDVGLTDNIEMRVGDTFTLQSLRQAVVPPYLMLMPFIQVKAPMEMQKQERLPGEGVHGVDYQLKATSAGEGEVVVGFKDLRSKEITHEKHLRVTIT
ncbi:MAG: hypothetical protein WKF37_05995 [Bryobacteraceae bacterium]